MLDTIVTPEPRAQSKNDLLNKLIDCPLDFTDADFRALLHNDLGLTFKDMREAVLRIFDINDSIFLEESNASNLLNRRSQKKRNDRFYKRFRKGLDRAKAKVIVAEGDSWFEFPYFINDIIDHLNDTPHYAIHSLAYGGDWLTNIIYEGRYVEKLSTLNPDVFLVSGGGNDLVGSDRIGIMVNSAGGGALRYKDVDTLIARLELLYGQRDSPLHSNAEVDVFMRTQGFVRPSFHSFILLMKLQYTVMFRNIHRKFPKLKIITQAYDYALPSGRYNGSWLSLHRLVNKFLKTGRWLYVPLMANGITDPDLQRRLVRYMIFEFNLMFAEIAMTTDNVFHIDCRGVAKGPNDWYDELHLKSDKYKEVADAYRACIDSKDDLKKIYFAAKK